MIADSGTASSGVTYYYYACSGKKNKHNGCRKQSLIKDTLETAVMDTIVEFMSKPAIIESIVEQVMTYQANMSKENPMLKIMQSQYESNKAMIQNTLNAIAQGIITRSTKELLEQLEAQQLDLEEKILIEKSKEMPILSREEVRAFYMKTLKSQGRSLINLIVKEILAYDDEIVIKLNTPLLKGPDDGQDFSICKRSVPLSNLIRLKMGQQDKGVRLILAV